MKKKRAELGHCGIATETIARHKLSLGVLQLYRLPIDSVDCFLSSSDSTDSHTESVQILISFHTATSGFQPAFLKNKNSVDIPLCAESIVLRIWLAKQLTLFARLSACVP